MARDNEIVGPFSLTKRSEVTYMAVVTRKFSIKDFSYNFNAVLSRRARQQWMNATNYPRSAWMIEWTPPASPHGFDEPD